MGKKIYPLNKLSYWRCYDVEMLGRVYGVHDKTVSEWRKKGLKAIDSKKPALFYGHHVKGFLSEMNDINKCKTEFHQLYCVKCHEGKDPLKNQIQIRPVKKLFIKAQAICRDCKTSMNKPYKLEDLPKLRKTFDIVQQLQLYDCKNPTVNTPFLDQGKGAQKELENQPIQPDLFR